MKGTHNLKETKKWPAEESPSLRVRFDRTEVTQPIRGQYILHNHTKIETWKTQIQ